MFWESTSLLILSENPQEETTAHVSQKFIDSLWYTNIIYVLRNLQVPPGLTKTKARFLKLKATKFYILDNSLYWKYPGGILLSCLLEDDAKKAIREFHKGDCEGYHYWKTTAHKILRGGYYWPSIFANVYKEVSNCHKCQIFNGRRKLQPLSLKPISVKASFMQWGLDFIGEIHLPSSTQHRWILTATDYFTKWIEAILTKQTTDTVIVQFLETNILSRFGCPIKIITNNATTFKSKKMEKFCKDYNITLGHSTAYYPQGNGLVESSNKSLNKIIKRLLQDNQKAWHKKLIYALWADRITTKKSISASPFQTVYGVDAIFPTSLGLPVRKLLQEQEITPDDMQRRINQLIHAQHMREQVYNQSQLHQDRMKKTFNEHSKQEEFQAEDLVLKWIARNEDKGKHEKSNHLWTGSFRICAYCGNNAYLLEELNGESTGWGPINGRFLKHYLVH
jgi:transposase InsO family protein